MRLTEILQKLDRTMKTSKIRKTGIPQKCRHCGQTVEGYGPLEEFDSICPTASNGKHDWRADDDASKAQNNKPALPPEEPDPVKDISETDVSISDAIEQLKAAQETQYETIDLMYWLSAQPAQEMSDFIRFLRELTELRGLNDREVYEQAHTKLLNQDREVPTAENPYCLSDYLRDLTNLIEEEIKLHKKNTPAIKPITKDR